MRTRYGLDLSDEPQQFWEDLHSLEAFVGVVTSPRIAETANELFKLVHFIYWIAPRTGSSFQESVKEVRDAISVIHRPKRKALQRAARTKLRKNDRLHNRSVVFGNETVVNAEFYKSWEWRKLRMKILKDRGRRCECCGATPGHFDAEGMPIRLCVDHIKPVTSYPEIRLDPNNLQVLCDECNMGKGAWDETDWRDAHQPSGDFKKRI